MAIFKHIAILCALVSLFASATASAAERGQLPDYPGLERVKVPGDGVTLGGYLARPTFGEPPYPAVMILPGFGQSATFALGSTASIADAGYVALVLSHRGTRGTGGRNECLADADFAAAAAWLARHPAVDANRIGIWGHSHGGRAALLAAARSDVPKAVVAYYTAPDLEKQQRGPLGTRKSCARREGTITASPILMVDRMNAPILFVQGDRDVRTPIEDVRAMHQKLLDAGKESRIHVIRGAGHGFFAADWVEARTAMLGHFAEQFGAAALPSELPFPAARPGNWSSRLRV